MAALPAPDDGQTGEARFLANLELIDQVVLLACRHHRLPREEADEFTSHVKLKLIEDNYGVLAKFQGKSSLRTFLTVVTERLLLDFRAQRWGKWRPSAEARRAGPLAIALEELMVRDGHGFDEACQILTSRQNPSGQVAAGLRGELEQLAARLPARVRRRFEADDGLVELESTTAPPDALLVSRDQHRQAERLTVAMTASIERLDTTDRLIMALHFYDGQTVAKIATLLGMDQRMLYRRLERLLRGLRSDLEKEGVDPQAALTLVANPEISMQWPMRGPERALQVRLSETESSR